MSISYMKIDEFIAFQFGEAFYVILCKYFLCCVRDLFFVAFPMTVIQQTRIEHMQAQNNRHNHFHKVHNVYVYHTFAH